MKIRLERIVSGDGRRTAELNPGEVVEHQVQLNIDGQHRTFAAYLRAKVVAGLDASLIYGDELLEVLLQFEPAALNDLCAAVGKYRRGSPISLPILLVDSGEEQTSAFAGNSSRG